MFVHIKNLQTRDCYNQIYRVVDDISDAYSDNRNYPSGYYFFCDELECYFGPYKTIDDVCKAQHKHYNQLNSL